MHRVWPIVLDPPNARCAVKTQRNDAADVRTFSTVVLNTRHRPGLRIRAYVITRPPSILLVSLDKEEFLDSMYKTLFKKLRTKANVSSVETSSATESALAARKYAAVLLTDGGLAQPKHRRTAQSLAEYARTGGTVIAGLHWATFTNLSYNNEFWRDAWGLPWKAGSYHRTTFALNFSSTAAQVRDCYTVSRGFSMKALHLKGIRPEEGMYYPSDDARLQSLVFPAEPIQDHDESPVVLALKGLPPMHYSQLAWYVLLSIFFVRRRLVGGPPGALPQSKSDKSESQHGQTETAI